ncbi:MAG: OsmC family protein [Deltaproteobacteria bacterium]|nr:OsmC family protein [Deltaproteobacteria bacterium]MCX7952502.1 OsmC family protein [Deltaproteobacteria bacterium]
MEKVLHGWLSKDKRIVYCIKNDCLNFCDVDKQWGGLGEYPNPRDVFSASVGLCVLAVVAIYLEKKLNVSFENIKFECTYQKGPEGEIKAINLKVFFPVALEYIKEELIRVAESCPVKKTLSSSVQIKTEYLFSDQLTETVA